MVSTHREALALFNRDVRLVLFSQALIGFTIFGGVYTVLLNLYLLRLGYGPQLIGQVNAVGALSFALLSMPAGLLANRWGARRSMIVGMVIAALGFGLLPLGEFAPPSVQLTWIMGAYALGVLGNTFYIVCSIPFLTLICPPRLRNHVFSTQVALWPLAGFAGSLCGGLLPGLFSALLGLPEDHPAPYRYPLLLAAGVLFISAGAIAATRSRPHKPPARERGQATPFPLAIILALSLVTFLQMAAENSLRIFFNVYMDDGLGVSTALIGSLTAGGQLLAACTALAAPALSRRFGRVPVITGGAGGDGVVPHTDGLGRPLGGGRSRLYGSGRSQLNTPLGLYRLSAGIGPRALASDHEFGADYGLRHQHCRRFARRRLDDRCAGVSGVVFD